jgi:hypothetical protein
MTRTAFDRQLSEIQEDMLVMAGMVENAIERGIKRSRRATSPSSRRSSKTTSRSTASVTRPKTSAWSSSPRSNLWPATSGQSSPYFTSLSILNAWETTPRASLRSR